MEIRTLQEAELVQQLFNELNRQRGRFDEQLVVFRYPEHASNSVGLGNLEMLRLLEKNDLAKMRIASQAFLNEFNIKLKEVGLKGQLGTSTMTPEEDLEEYIKRFNASCVWMVDGDATGQKEAWILIKLLRANVTVVNVVYGSDLHNDWNKWIED